MTMFENAYLPIDVLHSVMIIGIKFFCAVTILQVIVLIVHKIALERLNNRREALKDAYRSQLGMLFQQEDAHIRGPRARIEYEAFADVCSALMSTTVPKEAALIQRAVRRFAVPEYLAERFRRSHSWTARYLTIEKLGFLKLPELITLYRSILESDRDNRLIQSKVVWALSLVCREQDLPVILKNLSAADFMSAKFNEFIFCNVIAAFQQRGEAEVLLDRLGKIIDDEGVPILLKRDMVQACGVSVFRESVALIQHCAGSFGDNAEMRIATVRAMQRTGGAALDQMVHDGLQDADWRVRAVAAKDVGNCSDAIIPSLEAALGDRNYHVRLNAAMSLAQRGAPGIRVLREQTTSSDPFVRDASNYVLAR